LHLAGSDFKAVVGAQSRYEGSSAVILEMQPATRNGARIGEAVFRAEPGLRADRFSQMRLRLNGWHSEQKLFLFWRSSAAPDQQNYRALQHDPAGVSWHTLSDAETWQGDILELAIGVFGPTGTKPLRLHEVALHPTNRSVVIQRSLWDWSRTTPWTQVSANLHSSVRADVLWQPTTAATVWAGCGLVLTLLTYAVTRRFGHGSYQGVVIAGLSVILLPWLMLDLLWQRQLDDRLSAIQQRYGGLTQEQKHQREDDAVLQAYAAGLRELLAPLRGKRLFLLSETQAHHDYRRLRLQYHLLPLNIYNYGDRLLPAGQMRPGDHVLALAPTRTIRYRAQQGWLTDGERQHRAILLDEHPQGRLFRLTLQKPRIGEKHP